MKKSNILALLAVTIASMGDAIAPTSWSPRERVNRNQELQNAAAAKRQKTRDEIRARRAAVRAKIGGGS